MQPNKLPFQYLIRGQQLQYLASDAHAHAVDQRDRDLEDYLGSLVLSGGGGGGGIPPGGTVQQVLGKLSDADYDVSWRDPTWLRVKATPPTAADYGLAAIPVNAVWIVAP